MRYYTATGKCVANCQLACNIGFSYLNKIYCITTGYTIDFPKKIIGTIKNSVNMSDVPYDKWYFVKSVQKLTIYTCSIYTQDSDYNSDDINPITSMIENLYPVTEICVFILSGFILLFIIVYGMFKIVSYNSIKSISSIEHNNKCIETDKIKKRIRSEIAAHFTLPAYDNSTGSIKDIYTRYPEIYHKSISDEIEKYNAFDTSKKGCMKCGTEKETLYTDSFNFIACEKCAI